MKAVIWSLVTILIIVHQDFWFWEDGRLVFGFMPIGLFYHVCISIAAASVWFLATLTTWPKEVDYDGDRNTDTSQKVEDQS